MFLPTRKTYFIYICAITLVGSFQAASADIEANKTIATNIFEEIWNQGNLSVADEMIDIDLIRNDSGNPSGSGTVGREGFKKLVSTYRSAFPDIYWTINDLIAEGDLVSVRWTATGTHQGELMGIMPTGASVTGTGISLLHIIDGMVKEEWVDWDSLAMMQQLDVISPSRPSSVNFTWGDPSTVIGEFGDPNTYKVIVTRFTEEVWNQQNLDVMDEIFIDDVISHNPSIDYLYGPSSLEILKQGVTDYLIAFPDLHVIVEDMIAEGNKVVARWKVYGTYQSKLMNIPVTRNAVAWTGHTEYRFANGKIVELWWAWDTLGMMQQLTTGTAPWPEGMTFVDIPAGTFEMGDHFDVGQDHEKPIHTVSLSSFRISKYEVTNAQYAEYLNSAMADGLLEVIDGTVYSSDEVHQRYFGTSSAIGISQISFSDGLFSVGSRGGFSMADHPVVAVTWFGAKSFCDYYGYRLPTEAEWEYTARGGFLSPYFKYPWGSNSINKNQLNYGWADPLGIMQPRTTPIDYYPAYGYGLHSMAGNVSEWCNDWWAPDYYENSLQQDPQGPASGETRVLRGGNWAFSSANCRVAGRGSRAPSWYCTDGAAGFRPAKDMLALIAHWAFDEGEGITAEDSGRGYDTYVFGDQNWQPTSGKVDGAILLDGIDDYVLTSALPNLSDWSFSIVTWIKGGAPSQVILSQMGIANWLAVDSKGNLITELKSSDPLAEPLISDIVITDEQWHRVGFVWDGSNRKLYVDGVVVAEDTQINLQGSSSGLNIGTGKFMGPGTYWSGMIDDVRIYIVALSEEQISVLSR